MTSPDPTAATDAADGLLARLQRRNATVLRTIAEVRAIGLRMDGPPSAERKGEKQTDANQMHPHTCRSLNR